MAEKHRYSASQIGMFNRCGKQWEFRYLKNLKIPPGAALTIGKAVDDSVTANLQIKIETGEPASLAEALNVSSEAFDKYALETEFGDDDPGFCKDQTIQLSELHYNEVAPDIQPESVQEEFNIETSEWDIKGFMDVVEVDGKVRDTKTSGKKKNQNELFKNIQGLTYDWAYQQTHGKKAKSFGLDVLVKNKKPVVQRIETQYEPADWNWLFENIERMDKAIKAGVALPAPEGSWWCNEKWCGYWEICKGKKS